MNPKTLSLLHGVLALDSLVIVIQDGINTRKKDITILMGKFSYNHSPHMLTLVPSEQFFSNAAVSNGRGPSKNKFLCSYCGKTNHPVEKCFLLHGFPYGFGKGKGGGNRGNVWKSCFTKPIC